MSSVLQLLRSEQVDLYASASALRALESCPRMWWYKYAAGHPAEDVPARLVLGSAVHKGLAHFYGTLKDTGHEPSISDLIGIAGASISQALASDAPVLFGENEDAEGLVNEATRLFGAFMEQGYRPARVIGVEVPFALRLVHPETGEPLPFEERLVGAIDLVAEDDKSNIVVVDHKVGTRTDPQRAERADLQMGIYAWAAKHLYRVGHVALRYQNLVRTKTAKVVMQDVRRWPHDEAEALEAVASGLDFISMAVGSASGKRVMGRRRSWRCKDCSWRTRCQGDRT